MEQSQPEKDDQDDGSIKIHIGLTKGFFHNDMKKIPGRLLTTKFIQYFVRRLIQTGSKFRKFSQIVYTFRKSLRRFYGLVELQIMLQPQTG
jgi:hypothetical protein